MPRPPDSHFLMRFTLDSPAIHLAIHPCFTFCSIRNRTKRYRQTTASDDRHACSSNRAHATRTANSIPPRFDAIPLRFTCAPPCDSHLFYRLLNTIVQKISPNHCLKRPPRLFFKSCTRWDYLLLLRAAPWVPGTNVNQQLTPV